MIDLQLSRYLGIYAAACSMLAACGGSQMPIATPGIMQQSRAVATTHILQSTVYGIPAADSAKKGIYVSEHGNSGAGSIVYGYSKDNSNNAAPICSKSVTQAFSVAVDPKGNVIVTQDFDGVTVLKGPRMCGPVLGSFGTGIWGGLAVNAASTDAANGTIAVAAWQEGSGPGGIELCTLKAGCTTNLRNGSLNFVYGVAVAKDGDCWAASSQPTALVYFKGCSGSGVVATGYVNREPGGLDIDKNGNLVSFDGGVPAVYVYSGCNPACIVVGGPFTLLGQSSFGHLDQSSTKLVAPDYQYDQIDVYKYSRTSLTYEYSFSNGLSSGLELVSAAYDPGSKE